MTGLHRDRELPPGCTGFGDCDCEKCFPPDAPKPERKRVHMVKRTLVERCFFDPEEIRREFGEPIEGESYEDFVVRVFERFDGSVYGGEVFPGDASPEVWCEIEERWNDE